LLPSYLPSFLPPPYDGNRKTEWGERRKDGRVGERQAGRKEGRAAVTIITAITTSQEVKI
jgi:hypothetical protein